MKRSLREEINLRVTFADRLLEIRESRGMTQEQFARLLRWSRAQLANIESGRGTTTMLQLRRIAQKFNCSADWLLGLKKRSGE